MSLRLSGSSVADDGAAQPDTAEVTDWVLDTGLERLAHGREQLKAAQAVVQNEGATGQAEDDTRAALSTLRSAVDWLEDTDRFDEAHAQLDEAGAYTRSTFGCWLHCDGAYYEQRCPVALAHNRVGMSIAFVVEESECTICHQAPETCSHVTGRVYNGERCARLITKGRILEVSVVARPAQPDARFLAVSVPISDLVEALGPDFEPGMDVSCDRCLSPCDGVSRPWG
jgi:hypothetical protein